MKKWLIQSCFLETKRETRSPWAGQVHRPTEQQCPPLQTHTGAQLPQPHGSDGKKNSQKIVGKLLYFLPWLHRQVKGAFFLAIVQPARVAESCMMATPSPSLLATAGWAMQCNKKFCFFICFLKPEEMTQRDLKMG